MAEKIKIFCNNCMNNTKHDIRDTQDQRYCEYYNDNGHITMSYFEETEYRFLVCCGCDTATLEVIWTGSGMQDSNGDNIYSHTLYPVRKNLGERKIKKFNYVDIKLHNTYKEIITAFQQELFIVTAMGIRALLEGICVFEGIDDGQAWGLSQKIEKLKDLPNIPENIIDGLNGLKFIGDDAAHRLNTADILTLSLSIDLVESFLTHMYEARTEL